MTVDVLMAPPGLAYNSIGLYGKGEGKVNGLSL